MEKRRTELMKEVASPLYLEISDIKLCYLEKMDSRINDIANNYTRIWRNEIQNSYKEIWALNISKDIPLFYESLSDYSRRLNNLCKDNASKLNELFQKEYINNINVNYKINLYKELQFNLEYLTTYGETKNAYYDKSLILDAFLFDYLYDNDLDMIDDLTYIRINEITNGYISIDYEESLINDFMGKAEAQLYNWVGIEEKEENIQD